MKNMKTLFFVLLSLVLSGVIQAQDCGYYSMTKGMVFGYQNLDAKGKVTSTSRTTCLEINKVGAAVITKVKSDFTDAKTNNQTTREYDMRCEDGKFFVDMNSFVDPKSMEAFKGMEVSVNSSDMMYPAKLTTDQTLPDANITISAASGGISLLNLVMNITNRKVVGIESVTVPAGTFECYKITYDVETKLMFKMNTTVVEYLNMGVGNVKTETYDKKGKIISTNELIELKK